MNLTLHLFRKDIRQFRLLLSIWFALLLLHLAVDLGWVAQVIYTPAHGFERGSDVWSGLLPFVVWLLVALVPTFVVLTDSPARHDGFLATRPVPKSDVLLAKILFVLLFVVVPWVLVEWIHLAAAGVPGWVVNRGTFERLMLALPVAFGFAAYAALWRDIPRWARSVGIFFGVYIVCGISLTLIELAIGDRLPGASPKTHPLLNLNVAMLLMVIFCLWHARKHRSALFRWAGLAGVAALLLAYFIFWPWRLFAVQPVDPAAAQTVMNQTGFEISPRDFVVRKIQRSDGSDPRFAIDLNVHTPLVDDGYEIAWVAHAARLQADDGIEVPGGKVPHTDIFDSYRWYGSYSYDDAQAWAPQFPPDILFRQQNNMFSYNDSVSYNQFPLPSTPTELNEPLTFHAGLEARVYQWNKIADLPLTAGASSTDKFGTWKFVASKIETNFQSLFVERRQIELATATDSRCSGRDMGPVSHMAFMLYDPTNHTAWLTTAFNTFDASRSTDTALPLYCRVITFNGLKHYTPEQFARCRLIIFEKTWVGSVPEEWQSPAFTIADKMLPMNTRQGAYGDPMPLNEFERRIAALKVPAPDASRQEVSRYLLDFLRLVDARRYGLDDRSAQMQQLAALVPAHLDLLLDGLPVMDVPSRNAVIRAIKMGATDAQKPVIIAALYQEPDLATVLLERGWTEDARGEILRLAQYPHRLSIPAIRALVWLHDPKTYPRLLEEFKANANSEAFDMLRTLPELRPSLEEVVRRDWRHDSLMLSEINVWTMFGVSFDLALRDGQETALPRAYRIMADPVFEDNNASYYLANAFRNCVWMPGLDPLDRQDNDQVIAWMRKHRPEDFAYNPELRQFIPNPPAAGDQALNAHHP